jgi:hypothetical protein
MEKRDDDFTNDYEMKKDFLTVAWRGAISAYELGVANKVHHQALDDGPLFEEMEAIHVAGAYMELGEMAAALEFAQKAQAAFPESSPMAVMMQEIKKAIRAETSRTSV